MGWKFYVIGIATPILILLFVLGVSSVIANIYNYARIKKKKFNKNRAPFTGSEFSWEITPLERAQRIKKLLQRGVYSIFVIGSVTVILECVRYGYSAFFTLLAGMPWGLVVALLIVFGVVPGLSFLYSVKSLKYVLGATGITVIRGGRSFFVPWEKCEYFSERFYEERQNRDRDILGQEFYIKIQPDSFVSFIFNKVLFVQSEPENEEKVRNVLASMLPEEQTVTVPSFTLTRILFR